MMKRLLILALFLFGANAYGQTCTVSGNINDYSLYGMRTQIEIREVRRTGKILPIRTYVVPVASTGAFSFKVPQTVGTDTTKVRIFIDAYGWQGDFREGVWVTVPAGATANLTDLSPTTYYAPPTYAVAVPLLSLVDSSGGSYSTDSVRLGSGLRAITPTGGSGTPTIISTVTGGSDTTGTTNRPEMSNIENDIAALDDTAAAHLARISATEQTADAALPKADTTALHAQKFADVNDTLAAHKTAIDTKQNVLTAAQIARLDSSLAAGYAISITSAGTIQIIAVDTSGFFAAFGGVMTESDPVYTAGIASYSTTARMSDTLDANVVRAEVDPTATAKAQVVVRDSIDAAFTNGVRSQSSTGRIFAAMDSITFLGEAGDVIDLTTGNNFRGTISADDTLSFTGGVDGQVIQVVVTNAGTHTLAWTGVAWPGGTAPVLTAVANKRSIFSFLVSGGMVHGVSVLNY